MLSWKICKRYVPAASLTRPGIVLALLLPLTGCFLFSHPSGHPAPKIIGIVTGAAGSPSVIRHNQSYLLGVQSQIYAGDIVETDDGSRTRIEMIDHSIISFGGGSHCIFHRYDYSPGDEAPLATVTFTGGSIQVATAGYDDSKHPSFEVRTPVAAILIQGGTVWGGFDGMTGKLSVVLFDGEGTLVANDHGNVSLEKPRDGTTVRAGAAPQVPVQWSDQMLLRALGTTSL